MNILGRIIEYIVNPAVLVLFVIALVVFFYGIVRFLSKMSEDTERETGKRAMVGGLIGIVVMISVFAIIRLIIASLGLSDAGLPF